MLAAATEEHKPLTVVLLLASVQYARKACNWTTMTLHAPHHPIDFAAFEAKPFLVAPPSWRCRPEKRTGPHPLYRRVLSSHRLDEHTVVVVTRKAWLLELYDGNMKVDHGPSPEVTMRRSSYDWSHSYDMSAFNMNYDPVHSTASQQGAPGRALSDMHRLLHVPHGGVQTGSEGVAVGLGAERDSADGGLRPRLHPHQCLPELFGPDEPEPAHRQPDDDSGAIL